MIYSTLFENWFIAKVTRDPAEVWQYRNKYV